ncbi:hypothetical protein BH10CHL1_BH10CHL1_49560 [soil metagenome]
MIDSLIGLLVDFSTTLNYDASRTAVEIRITVLDSLLPIGPLSDGTLLTLKFGVKSGCRTTDGTRPNIQFLFGSSPLPSFGNILGFGIAGQTFGATIPLRFAANPSSISFSSSTINENLAINTAVGSLTSFDLDADLGDTQTYSLVSGTGSTDNSSFTIAGASLKTNAVFDYETKSSYSIRVRSLDSYGGLFEKVVTIAVHDVNEVASISYPSDNPPQKSPV